MNFRKLFFGGSEKREGGYHPSAKPPVWIQDGGISSAGVRVSYTSVTSLPGVYACISLVSDLIACLPLVRNREDREGDMFPVKEHDFRMLSRGMVNPWMNHLEFRQVMSGALLLKGDAFAFMEKHPYTGKIRGFYPMNPDHVTPVLVKNSKGETIPAYQYSPNNGTPGLLFRDEVLHIKGPSDDGIQGWNLIEKLKDTWGISLAAQQYAERTFANDSTPRGALKFPNALKPERAKQLRDQWNEVYGEGNSGRMAILESGMEWVKISMTPEEAQLLPAREFQLEDTARIFRIPPHMVGHLKRATFNNIEEEGRRFLVYTLNPWLLRWTAALMTQLLPEKELETDSFEFNVDALLRGDTLRRYQAFAIARQWGWMNANEIRRRDSMPKEDGLDSYYVPLNMVDAQTGNQTLEEEEKKSLIRRVFSPLVDESIRKFKRREFKEYVRRDEKGEDALEFLISDKQKELLRGMLFPLIGSMVSELRGEGRSGSEEKALEIFEEFSKTYKELRSVEIEGGEDQDWTDILISKVEKGIFGDE